MPKVTVIELRAASRSLLEQVHRNGASPAYRRRCQMILLKSQGRTSRQVAELVGVHEMSVPKWVHRYQEHGIAGLETKAGRGRKAILQECDLEAVKAAVALHRQRLSVAKAKLEESLGKSFCQETWARFVKKTVGALNESASVPVAAKRLGVVSRSRKFTNSKSRR